MRFKTVIKRILIYFLLVTAAFIIQTCIFPMLSFFTATPNLILIITFSYGFIYGSMTGLICGMFSGLMMDLFYTSPMGLFILIYSFLGFFSGIFAQNFRNDHLTLPLLLAAANCLFYNLSVMLYRYFSFGVLGFKYAFVHIILPEMFFTVLLTLFIYRVLLHTNRRLDKIDDLRGKNVA